MTLVPQDPFPKQPRDPLRPEDWNDLAREVVRLGDGTVTKAGDTVGSATARSLTVTTSSVTMPDGTLSGVAIKPGSLPAAAFAADSVPGTKFADLPADRIWDQTIPGTAIADASIPGTKIQDGGLRWIAFGTNAQIPGQLMANGSIGAGKLIVTTRTEGMWIPAANPASPTFQTFEFAKEIWVPTTVRPLYSFFRVTGWSLEQPDGTKAVPTTTTTVRLGLVSTARFVWWNVDPAMPNGGFKEIVTVQNVAPQRAWFEYEVVQISGT
jgi:hypothetical protein